MNSVQIPKQERLALLPTLSLAERRAIRQGIVDEARSWLGTPFHIAGRVKGAGVDCGQLLYCVWHACGFFPEEETGLFAGDWFCHTTEEKYRYRIMRHAFETAEGIGYATMKALPGSLMLVKALRSNVYNHGGIVVEWPRVIHAGSRLVEEVNATYDPMWANMKVMNFDIWPEGTL
jgi:cell wall-associated NlpC family hydrolase